MFLQIKKNCQRYFERYGWKYKELSDSKIITGWSSFEKNFKMIVSLGSYSIQFDVVLINLENKIDKNDTEFYKCINDLNNIFDFVKIYLNEKSEVIIRYEIYHHAFNYDVFEFTLGILGNFSDLIFTELGFCEYKKTKPFDQYIH